MRLRLSLLALSVVLAGGVATATAGAAGAAICGPAVTPVDAVAIAEVAGTFHGIAPTRVADSRARLGFGDTLGADCVTALPIPASAAPLQARAVSLNVTTADSRRPGYLVVFPCGTPTPATSNVNSRVGAAIPNLVIVPLPPSRTVCFFADHVTNVIVDVTGWFGSQGAGYISGPTNRVLDTRNAPRPAGTGLWPAQTELALTIAPTPSTWEAAAVNVTVTDAAGPGYVVAYPCGQVVPPTSTVNMLARETRANQTLVALDATGRLCLWSNVATHLIVDIVGHFAKNTGAALAAGAAQRIVDSRSSFGGWTSAFRSGLTRSVDPSGGRPQWAATALLNVVATNVTEAGYLTFYRCDGPVPPTSSLNFAPGRDSTNLVTVDSNTCVTGTGTAHVVIDRLGWFGRPGGLASLSIGPPGALQPEFEPDGHDYSLPCVAGQNLLAGAVVAAPGRRFDVLGGPPGQFIRDVATYTGGIEVSAGAAIKIVVGAGTTTETYSVRCLPPDFPPLQSTVTGSPAPGWYLTSIGYNVPGGVGNYAVIFDEHGAVVWYRKTAQSVIDVKRLASGNVAWINITGAAPFGIDPTKGYEEHRLDGSLVATYKAVNANTDHHDFRQLPNGHVLVLAYVKRTGVDLTALGAGFTANDTVLDSVIQEIDPAMPPGSAPVWTWSSKDHFGVTETTFPQRFDTDGNGTPDSVDLAHVNSIEPQPNGDIVASFRHLDAVARIDRSTGAVVWKVGGTPTTHDAGAAVLQIVDDPRNGPARQHAASLLPNGNLTMFDDRTTLGASIGPARAVEYALDLTAKTARLVWHLDDPLGRSAFGLGSVQRVPDGDTLVAWGAFQPMVVEYDATGHEELRINQPTGGNGYRVIKEPQSSFDRDTLRANAG